jgi:uncharacterized Zn-finger protein
VSEIELGQLELRGDTGGYVSRQCPFCARVFKLQIARIQATDAFAVAYCPYCYSTNTGEWYTDAQREFLQAAAQRAAMQWVTGKLQDMLRDSQKPGLHVSAGEGELPPEPAGPPDETNDGFAIVDVPCHPDDAFKISTKTAGEVACPICGIQYDVTDITRVGAE